MKIVNRLPVKIRILILVAVIVVAVGVTAYIKFYPTTTDTYKLTHTAADAEYILSWDEIVSRCPEIGKYDKQEFFFCRGETAQTTPETPPQEEDSPAAWGSYRFVFAQAAPTASQFRGFGVLITYFDTAEYLDEYMSSAEMSGPCFQEEGDFWTAVLASGPPTQSVQLHIAGNQFYILFLDTASSDESLFFSKEELMELLPGVKSNISSLEITALPPTIPERIVVEDTYEWHEFMTFHADELSPPVRVPEGQHYNDLRFSERPLMQVFNVTIDKDCRFVMTATGEVGTTFEVYATVTSSGEEGFSYSSDQVFSLCRETVTFTREQPLEEGYAPPVDVEIRVFFDLPISWVITIEK
jgi:hypothetical protein